MNILAKDTTSNINLDKAKILNSAKKQVSKTLNNLETSINTQKKNITLDILLDSLFKDLSSNQKSKNVVLQILQDKTLFLDAKETTTDLKSILSNLKNSKLPLKNTPILQKLLLDIKDISGKTIQKQISQSGLFFESNLLKADTSKTLLPTFIQEPLNSLKTLITENGLNIDKSLVDKILNHKTADKNFINTINELVQNTKISKNQAIVDVLAKLDNLIQKNQLLESKISNDIPINSTEVKTNIKEILVNFAKLDISKPQIKKMISQLNLAINQIQNSSILDKSQLLNLNLSQKLQRAVNLIKSELALNMPKIDTHVKVAKLIQTLQTQVYENIANKQIVPNQPLLATQNTKEAITQDIKANLLYIKDELGKSKNINLPETMAKIDKVLTNINYYQLLSFSSNSNMLYLPLLWEELSEGQISIKKLKQKRYFCEINLKLKEFGKIDMLIMLFDDIFINISIFSKSTSFLTRIKENLKFLKVGINNVGLVPSNIYLYDSLKDDKIKKDTKSYVDSQQIGNGVNIHV
ncbi:MAG: hypothetical protein GXP61_10390 [Epsilonproteobacteria bacterium]|nr:hypothetical protein [Campylobacterota bacterium]